MKAVVARGGFSLVVIRGMQDLNMLFDRCGMELRFFCNRALELNGTAVSIPFTLNERVD